MRMLALWGLLPGSAVAADLLVPDTYQDIGAALAAADLDDRILVDGNTYTGEIGLIDHLVVNQSVAIEGVNRRPIIPGLLIRSGHDVTLTNLGFEGPGLLDGLLAIVRQTDGTLTVDDVELPTSENAPGLFLSGVVADIDGLVATGFSGERPVEARGASDVTIRNSTFTDHNFGAVIVSEATSLVVEDSTFARNFAGRGADLEVLDQSSAIVRGSTFVDSFVSNGGGSVYVERSALELDTCSFTDATADGAGGAVFATLSEAGVLAGDPLYALVVKNSKFERTEGVDQGGALLINAFDAVIENSDFVVTTLVDGDLADNNRPDGGAIATGGGSLTIRGSTFMGFESPGGQGGAVAVLNGLDDADPVVLIEDSTFTGNSSVVEARRGGAIDLQRADAILQRVTITDTEASEFGGAVYMIEGSLFVRGLDVDRTHTDGLGGGIRVTRSDLDLGGSDFTDVSALDGGALVFGDGSANTLTVDGVKIIRASASDGASAIAVESAFESWIRRSKFCQSGSTDPTAAVVEYRGDLAGGAEFHNNIAIGNPVQAIVRRGLPNGVDAAGGTLEVRHNTLLESNGVEIYQGNAGIADNIFAFAEAGVLAGDLSGAISGDYNLWWTLGANALPTSLALPGVHAVFAEPGFVSYTEGDCAFDGWLIEDAPARGAGSPADGTGEQGDIGATGGPGTILADADQDGWREDLDCDESDPNVNPGATEDWSTETDEDCDGNGRDQDEDGYVGEDDCDETDPDVNAGAEEIPGNTIDEDCDGNLGDVDGDGYDGAEDCDDNDPDIHPNATELPGDDVDQDCDGDEGESRIGGSCGCASTSPRPGLILALGLGLVARRRRAP